MPDELSRYLAQCRALIDDALDRRVPPLGSAPPILHEAVRYTLLAPGKRLRGVVVLTCSDMFRGNRDAALSLACSVEMVHAASLILDDLPSMDDASLRRGKPVLHRAVGEANAILASVTLLNSAFGVVQGIEELRPGVRTAAAQRLSHAIGADGLIGGQVVDLESTGEKLDLEGLEYIHSHKTGALFIAAAEMGAVAAGARAREIESLSRFAKNLGLAFQITDDLLDHSGSPETTGKDAGLDRNKTTFVDFCGIDGSRRLVDELIDASLDALRSLGRRAERLMQLAEFVRHRDR